MVEFFFIRLRTHGIFFWLMGYFIGQNLISVGMKVGGSCSGMRSDMNMDCLQLVIENTHTTTQHQTLCVAVLKKHCMDNVQSGWALCC